MPGSVLMTRMYSASCSHESYLVLSQAIARWDSRRGSTSGHLIMMYSFSSPARPVTSGGGYSLQQREQAHPELWSPQQPLPESGSEVGLCWQSHRPDATYRAPVHLCFHSWLCLGQAWKATWGHLCWWKQWPRCDCYSHTAPWATLVRQPRAGQAVGEGRALTSQLQPQQWHTQCPRCVRHKGSYPRHRDST